MQSCYEKIRETFLTDQKLDAASKKYPTDDAVADFIVDNIRDSKEVLVEVSKSTDLPQLPSHAWENCKQICTSNKNCTSFDYCFVKETKEFEIFNCFMKGNTFSETFLKTPNHCVKSVKQNCSVLKN